MRVIAGAHVPYTVFAAIRLQLNLGRVRTVERGIHTHFVHSHSDSHFDRHATHNSELQMHDTKVQPHDLAFKLVFL